MYQYKYVQAALAGFFSDTNYREIIDQHAKEGWRFVQFVPIAYNAHGRPTECEIIFEKKTDDVE